MKDLFEPRSIAIIGASTTPTKFGYIITDFLQVQGFRGKIYPINPNASEVCGLKCYPSIMEVPDEVDVATIVLPAEQVLKALEQCCQKGVKGVVTITSGFAETAGKGKELQETMTRMCKENGMRMIGPNCEGFLNLHQDLVLTFSLMFRGQFKKGGVSYVSHSGAYTGPVFRRILAHGLGFSKVVSSGNEADVTAIDLFEYLAEDPQTNLIISYLEEIRNPKRFLAAMPEITKKKPVIINKSGRTSVGSRAASSHTGALAGSDKVIDAVFKQTGVVRVRDMDELVDTALGLGTQPLIRGNRVGILSVAGGFAVEMADLSVEAGLAVAALEASTKEGLSKIIPYYGSTNNPVDLTARALENLSWPGECVALAAKDPNLDAVVLILTAMREIEICEGILKAMRGSDKPILICWTAGDVAGAALEYLKDNGVPVFPSPKRMINALRGMVQYAKYILRDEFREA